MKHQLYKLASCLILSALLAAPASYAETQEKLSRITEAEADVIRVKNKRDHLPVITIDELRQRFDEIIVVDARSEFEYQTLHIKNALSIPVANRGFEPHILALREKHPDKTIAFYCNGFVCGKSYEATDRALKAGLTNVFTFDRGIFAWADKYPQLAILLEKSEMDHKKLIQDELFDQHTLPSDEFEKRFLAAKEAGAMLIDIRTVGQQQTYPAFASSSRKIETDAFVKNLKKFRDHPLYIVDQAGEQVRWLQYHLEEEQIKEYFFLEGGAHKHQQFQ